MLKIALDKNGFDNIMPSLYIMNHRATCNARTLCHATSNHNNLVIHWFDRVSNPPQPKP